LNLLWL